MRTVGSDMAGKENVSHDLSKKVTWMCHTGQK